ncbi:hypothetical protein SODALDRAFT_31006 [Sodiomyces alkalinus F11]|uniref:RFX-type winged-helix domain-containing protein n=1 Tax=Sodiomyces alkalinus (strain CBS 110278 / VKM F-3762 / F11) TaxID=1314773 RepID=A0A3N2Q8N1_SODAK|nr:hypothetical protein SODALDRAFT_31006 [Sodiomyces alkalinus F11]ROT43112.1 hypothetical protein SODALDRAFT_31006 [Sodiomyces alkalinus F11]
MEQDPTAPGLMRKRPQSRGSTASVTTQPGLEQPNYTDAEEIYSAQWVNNDQGHPKPIAPAPRLSSETMMLQAASHMQSIREYPIAPAAHGHINHSVSFNQQSMPSHSQPSDSMVTNSFPEDSQMLDRDDMDDRDSMASGPAVVKSAAAKSSANNELEMRHLFNANKHRNLQEVAKELHGNERGPNSERTRQVFAMLWINSVCSKGKGSVPRGRVYANYASRCATERITVLNPASFGKLVRVLFPGLKTRRLGVRGESKYHYVNFHLVDDQPDLRESEVPVPITSTVSNLARSTSTVPSKTPGAGPSEKRPQATTSARARRSQSPIVRPKRHSSSHSFYSVPELTSADQLHTSATKVSLELSFPSEHEDSGFNNAEPLALPRIEPFLPDGTDPDAAKSLSALYRSHCTSLVECVRFCKEKTLFHLYTSFQGTLTMPVQKLFSHPDIAPWIEQCDFVLYQRMMQIVAALTLQVVPKPVMDTLRSISVRLVPHIREAFQGQPLHVARAKEAPATLFSALLDRALKVNITAHAAANMLSNPANRDQMYLDWITMVSVRKVAESVPTRAMDDLVNLMVSQIRDLVDPQDVPWEVECLTVYGDIAARKGTQTEGATDSSTENVLDRWVALLKSLPERFPFAQPSDLVYGVQRVGTAVMRDLTMAQGKSFGTWWVTKCWLDEMVSFLAEKGGFMKMKSSRDLPIKTTDEVKENTTRGQGSRYSSGSDDFNFSNLSQAQPDKAPFPSAPSITQSEHAGLGGSTNPDDSGIGIRTPDEEFPMEKYTFPQGDDDQALLPAPAVEQ